MAFKRGALENRINAARNGGCVHLRRLMFIGLMALAFSACGTGDALTPATAADPDGPTVAIEDLAFEPEMLTVKAGDTVTWVWDDGTIDHDVAGDDFHSEVMSEGTFSQRFDEPGTYDYVCTLHPNMTGTIEVAR